MDSKRPTSTSYAQVREYYNEVYYGEHGSDTMSNRHLRELALKLQIHSGQRVLDIACGTGQWLAIVAEHGGSVAGIDISDKAIAICQQRFTEGEFFTGLAESLPFPDQVFDVVTCFGSLEHFLQPREALREMSRVAKPNNSLLVFSVPNAGFWLRRLGLFYGTAQTNVREEVLTYPAWKNFFEANGLLVEAVWPDWHIIDWKWIQAGAWFTIPIRAIVAWSLLLCPLDLQYQLYFLCRINNSDTPHG